MSESDVPPPPRVAGVSLCADTPYVITPEENQCVCESVGAVPAPDGSAHPIWFFIGTHAGMSKTIAGLCAACNFDVQDGPMLASSSVTFQRPLLIGQPYGVSGEIRGLTRKASRKLGCMDVLEYELCLSLPEGAPVLTSTNLWVLPRGQRANGRGERHGDERHEVREMATRAVAGDPLPPLRVESVSAEAMKHWARLLRDPNPIHLDPAVVRANGWGDSVINQGPANLAYVITMLQKAFPAGFVAALDVRYVDNVFGGEAVEAGGTITQVLRASDGRTRITCEIWLRADARDLVIQGTAVMAA